MIFFLLSKKWKIYFNIRQNWAELLIQFLWLLFLVSLTTFAGVIYDSALQHIVDVNPSSIIKGIDYSLLLLPILLKFFPSLSHKKIVLKRNYPLSRKKWLIFDLLYSVLSETWIFFMLIICLVLSIFSSISIVQLLQLIIIGLSGSIVAENLINAYYNNKNHYLFSVLLLILIIVSLIQKNVFIKYPLSVCLIFLSSGIVYYLTYKPLTNETSKKVFSKLTRSKHLTLKIAMRNKKYLSASFFAIIIQIVAAFALTILLKKNIEVVIFYLISFSFLFSYCYNNAWGFFTSTGLNLIIAGCEMKDLLIILCKFFTPNILLNFSLYIIYFYFFPWALTLKFVIGFVTLSFFSFIVAIFFSFLKMRIIIKAISLSVNSYNTSIIATHIVGIVCLLVGYSQAYNVLYYVILGIILILSFISCIILFKKQKTLIKILSRSLIYSCNNS